MLPFFLKKKVNQIPLLPCDSYYEEPLLSNLQGLDLSFIVTVVAVMGSEYHHHVSTVISQYTTTPCTPWISLNTAISIHVGFILACFSPSTQRGTAMGRGGLRFSNRCIYKKPQTLLTSKITLHQTK